MVGVYEQRPLWSCSRRSERCCARCLDATAIVESLRKTRSMNFRNHETTKVVSAHGALFANVHALRASALATVRGADAHGRGRVSRGKLRGPILMAIAYPACHVSSASRGTPPLGSST